MATTSKLELTGGARVYVSVNEAGAVLVRILTKAGCPDDVAAMVADHLIDASLSGVESHGIMRVMQYAEQFRSGYMSPSARAQVVISERGMTEVDGCGGIGIPAMTLAVDTGCKRAKTDGLSVLPVRNCGHTGRLGAFAQAGAELGCLVMIIGGGGRQNWRQVAPFGGRKAVLPTNPYCFGMPGGARGPVVVDFATSAIAGGWLFAARSAGALVPPGTIIDADGSPSRDPDAYFSGGAILPKGGPMGYGLAVMAEMICDAMLGPATTEVNWLVLAIDTERFRAPSAMRSAAEEILAELRACPPAAGFDAVEVPGERERTNRASGMIRGISLPEATWREIQRCADGH